MQPPINSDENWNIVVAGQWNPRVFTPQWVGSQLLGDPQLEVLAQLLPGAPSLQYRSGEVVVYPGDEAFMVVARHQTDDALRRTEAVVLTALRLLEHTPVAGVGINFTQMEAEPSERLLRLLPLADDEDLARFGCDTRQTDIARQLMVRDRLVNVRMTLSEQGVAISLNFHLDVRSAAQASAALTGQAVLCREVAAEFLHTVYDTTLRSEEVHESV